MKVAYTSNIYPFQLSFLGSKYYYSLKGISLFFYRRMLNKRGKWKRIDSDRFLNEHKDYLLDILVYTVDHGPVLSSEFIGMDMIQKYFTRHEPDLIQTIEKLKEKASGKFCQIKIIEIPDKTEYKIVMNGEIAGESILVKCECCNSYTKRLN